MSRFRAATLSRRKWAALLAASSSVLLDAESAEALRAAPYGGRLRLSLPLGLRSLDPHDPSDLGAAILGPNLFEPLYQKTSSGQIYPALAGMPKLEGTRLKIELRPHLRFSSGQPITSAHVVASLNRAKASCAMLEELGTVTSTSRTPREIWLSLRDEKRAALLLSSPLTALVPKDYLPQKPVASGAFRVKSLAGGMLLERNPFAPRGGSYLSEVMIRTRTPLEGLRDFEARDSHVGYFGAGLHQTRRDARPFSCGPTGILLALCGSSLKSLAVPGALNEALRYLPAAPFAALGLERARADVRPYRGQDFELLVGAEDPWLTAVAAELQTAWSTVAIKITPVSHATLLGRRRAGTFDAMLLPRATRHMTPEAVMNDLFALAGRKAPQGGRVLSVEESLRQLNIGLVGTFHARGAVDRSLITPSDLGFFDLSGAILEPPRS